MGMDLRECRIGYVPISPNFNASGDRRRFWHYARARGLRFEVASPTESYDVVVLTQNADVSVWSQYERNGAKVVFDFIDSYLSIPRSDLKGRMRGVAKFIKGENSRLRLDYWKALEDMCRRADAVICSTEEQQARIRPLCGNIHLIQDCHAMLEAVKTDYEAGNEFNLVWEGLPENIAGFSVVADVLRAVSRDHPITLHLVTNLEYRPMKGLLGRQSTLAYARRFFDRVCLYEWNEATAPGIMTACDLAMIPIIHGDSLAQGKPETKLLLFWRMGLPALVSATPAYTRAMKACGLDMACATSTDWERALRAAIASREARADAGRRGRTYALSEHGEDRVLERWDQLFSSLFT